MTGKALQSAAHSFREPVNRIREYRQAGHEGNAVKHLAISQISQSPHRPSAAKLTRSSSDALSAHATGETLRQTRRNDFHTQNRANAAKLLRP